MARSRMRGVGRVLCWLLVAGCSPTEDVPRARSQPRVLRMHRPLQVLTATLQAGADCSETGKNGCLSGICAHLSSELEWGYRCVTECGPDRGCTELGWRCVDVPGTSHGLCLPPAGLVDAGSVIPPSAGSVQ